MSQEKPTSKGGLSRLIDFKRDKETKRQRGKETERQRQRDGQIERQRDLAEEGNLSREKQIYTKNRIEGPV